MKDKPVRIYKITNTTNGKLYFGQTNQPGKNRWRSHLRDAASGARDIYLYRAIRKCGSDAFTFEYVAEAPDKKWGDYLETMYILLYDTMNGKNGYNMMSGGQGGRHLPENKAKIGTKSKEWWSVPQNKERASESRKGLLVGERNPMFGRRDLGRPHTEEIKQLLSEQAKERFADPEYKARMSAANTGKHHTAEGRENIRQALLGNTYRLGTTQSEEAKAKISESLKRAFAEGRRIKTNGPSRKGIKLGPMPEEVKLRIAEGVRRARQEKFWSTRPKESQLTAGVLA